LTINDPDQRAYLVLVSEIMLQQTQVPRVVVKYKEFVQRFPNLEALSKATNADILIAWRGMGYNSRALRLRDAARSILLRGSDTEAHSSQLTAHNSHVQLFPTSMSELQSIPGIGHYTAAAIRNFAFNIPTPCLDTNIRRILHRFFVGPEKADGTWRKDDRYLLGLAGTVLKVALQQTNGFQGNRRQSLDSLVSLDSLDSSAWHAALMDFGSLVMTKNRPKWELLSPDLRSICKAYGKEIKRTKKLNKTEPGREIAGRHVPRRITRGKVIDVLREHRTGLTIEDIGPHVAIDWSMGDHRAWLLDILQSLERDGLIERSGKRFRLRRS
jgi:A/G-specific adenine glycosylase